MPPTRVELGHAVCLAIESRGGVRVAVIEHDGRGDYEVSVTGFKTEKVAAAARARAKAGFVLARLERI